MPTHEDFVGPSCSVLDAQYAWKQFGGLSLDQAYERFCDRPDIHQEDFMFMGAPAFVYYFPVIERYLYTVHNEDEFHDVQAWILGRAITLRIEHSPELEENDLRKNTELIARVDALVQHVLSNLAQYAVTAEERERIKSAWVELGDVLSQGPLS